MRNSRETVFPDPFAFVSGAMLASIAVLTLGFGPFALAQPNPGDVQRRILAQASARTTTSIPSVDSDSNEIRNRKPFDFLRRKPCEP